ncbi:MAG TPA: hypothetical protein VLH08_10260 [Acidobacteriota bacterium]|nr:hypothetical protein [Acidobacteriota bacterium]
MMELSNGDFLGSSLDHSNPTLIRFDKNGNVLSASEYMVQNKFRNVFDQLIETQDGGFLAAGLSFKDPIVVKFNSTGIPEWQIVIPGKFRIYSIAQTQDGYLAVGSQNRTNSVQSDAWIIKLNRTGRVVWSKILEQDNNVDRFQFVKQARDGSYIVVGTLADFATNPDPKMIVAKLDAQGKLIWNNTYSYNEPFPVQITAATVTPTEGLVLVGRIGASAVVIKVGSAGGIHWAKTFENRPHDLSLEYVVRTRDGGYVAAGTSDQYRGPDNRGLLLKVDPFGKLLWSRRTSAQLFSVDQTQDNGFIVSALGVGIYGIMKTDERGFIPNCRLLRRFPLSGSTLQVERHTNAELNLKSVNSQSQSITISTKKISSVTGDDQCN